VSTPAVMSPVSIRELLFGAEEDTRLEEHLGEAGSLDSLDEEIGVVGNVGRNLVTKELSRVILEVIDSDLASLLGAAWRKHSKLRDAARRTVASPGTEEQVVLATHRMSSVQEPSVDLILDGVLITTIDLALQVSFEIRGLLGTVREGKLVGLEAGSCSAEGSLEVEGVEVARRGMELDLTTQVALGNGITLLPAVVGDQP
jgi:hypothetical protein